MTKMTSVSHPLRIAEVSTGSGGRVGLTFCPGKKQRRAASGRWDRDLAVDLDAIRDWGASAVVTLVESHELRDLGVEDMPRAVAARGMAWHHLPIRDVSVPDEAFEAAYERVRRDLHARLAEGRAVLVHCMGGLGRTGLLAARLLVETGHDPEDAIALVRAARPGAIETHEQEAYVRAQGRPKRAQRREDTGKGRGEDWFERLTGFRESGYEVTRRRLGVVDGRLHADGRDRGFAVGALTLPSLAELRARTSGLLPTGRPRLSIVEGDVRAMHALPVNVGALFQVASQFNMLEMVAPGVTPEEGVTRYQHDRTQGPACAMAAGAATIYRNYLVPVGGDTGQTATRQLDGLGDLGEALTRRLGPASAPPWAMLNGYAMATREGLASVDAILREADAEFLDDLRGRLRVGLQGDVEVTDRVASGRTVSQIFCSALPVAYAGLPPSTWTRFARLVLEAAYEATLLAGVLNADRGASDRVLLTRLGGGAFGNADAWIDDAITRALRIAAGFDLEVIIVSYGAAASALRDFVTRSGFASDGREAERSARAPSTVADADSGADEVPEEQVAEEQAREWNMTAEGLAALARWLPVFRSEGFTWGRWQREPGQFGWFETSPQAVSFVEDAYRHGWVYMGWNWSDWAQTDEARRFRDEPVAMGRASGDDLGRLLTVCIRGDRFCEGSLAEAYDTGLLTKVVARAAELAT